MRPFEALPKHVALELTSHCNRNCWFCPRWGDRSGKRKDANGNPVIRYMPSEHVSSLMKQVWDMGYRDAINFHHLSEPFLDKRLVSFARMAKEMGFPTIIHTNGDVIRNNRELAFAAAEVFDEITVGLYDYTSEEERISEEAFWVEYMTEAGVKKLHFTHKDIVFPRHDVNPEGQRMEDLERSIELARQHPCEMVREHLIVHYDGNVALCCEDYPDQFNLDNAFVTPLRDIWWGDRRREVIETLSKPGGRLHYPHCAKCPFAPTQHLYTIIKAQSEVTENENVYPLWPEANKA